MARKCIFCDKNLKNSARTVIGTASLEELIKISRERGDNFHKVFSTVNFLKTHLACRNKYVSKIRSIRKPENVALELVRPDEEMREIIEVAEIVEEEEVLVQTVQESMLTCRQTAFEQTCTFMEESDECQFKIEELVDKMKSFLTSSVDPYPIKYFVQKLKQKFGDDIIICKAKGVENFVCFKGQLDEVISSKILKLLSEEDIFMAAAQIIKRDVRSYLINAEEYPSFEEISTGGAASLPRKLHHFMNMLLLPKKPLRSHRNKSLAIQNSMMSLMRPRFVPPLLFGIGTLIHRRTNSRYIMDILNAFGFSSSYSEIMNMQKRAAAEPQRKKLENAYIQHSWDNADINTRTLTGHGTWHSMGGLECVTPSNCAIVTSNLPRGESTLSAKEVGRFGYLPIKTYMKPKVNGLKHMKIESLDGRLTENEETVRSYVSTECLWICGRLFDFYFQPSWFGYNAHITKEISGFAITKTTPLPFINLDPGNLSTIYTALCFTAAQCKELNQSIGFATFDQPLYIKAVTMVKSANPSSDISKLIIRLGGFHLLMSFLGCIGYIMNGSGIEELYSQVYAKNSVVHMLSGHAYSRSIRACLLVQEAISHLVLELRITFTTKERSHLQSIFETFDVSICKELNEPLLETIESTLNTEFEILKVQSRTCALWIQFWHAIQIIKNYIKAERCGDWNMELLCVEKMIPYFHAAGRTQYAKCAQIYLQDMVKLKEVMPSAEHKKFVDNSFFTIRRTSNFFAGTWTDMVIEQDLMRPIKVSGGLNHGRGTSDNSLAVWMGALPYCSEVINSIEKLSGKFFTTSEQHVELRVSREEKDRIDFNKFKDWLKEHNPFDQTKPELYSISTGVVATSTIDCDRAVEIGTTLLKEKIGQNFDDVKMSYKGKVKPLGFAMKSMKLNGHEVIINPHQLFHRMLTVMPTLEQLRDSFNFELASYPLSMFDENGIRKYESTSMFKHFDKIQGSCNIEFTHENSVFFVSGEFLLNKVLWNTTQTYGEVIDQYINHILYYYGRNNVTIIFDGPKEQFWQSQIAASTTTAVLIEAHIKATVNQSKFLSNDTSKLRLVDFLIKRLKKENIRVYQSENTSNRLIAKLAISESKDCCKNVVVVSEDLDLLMLLIDQATNQKVFMVRSGKKTDKTSHVANIQTKLGKAKELILIIHSFSGTKITSAFYKKGKITFLKKVMTNDDILKCLHVFNTPNADIGKLFEAGEKLLLCVYGATKEMKSINSFRYELFNKINRKKKLNQIFNLATLPPTMLAVQQHILRTYFQVQKWKYNILNPTDWGWIVQDNGLRPVRSSNVKLVPDWLQESIFCNCKIETGCKNLNCYCKKFGMSCTEACGYCHSECTNRTNFDSNNDYNDLNEF